ncbi:valine--tRNA ligase [Candidatus Xianfuyuplasma coldseepsis]|uniref:Valine--tRNA ligase n=1 Tax=Candidatus Xianfuyuplasma coldseepsis TaxID=2782163 RepID=A0A7L7KVK6_9MOLU|nr:valine--tRNA ligase [Xianfuyuplasma coldseepsis]QMS85788.1 valine--tRNA ligase [Xianfuyuplasma coldseepsis]
MKELPKKYDHHLVEEGKYDFWLKGRYFKSGDKTKTPYTIVIPPPNVTGKLHLGHAWDNTLQDIIIRRKRMQGFDALYLPGMDHAGIATQAKVDAKLRDQGTSRYELGREKFLEVAWDWKHEYAGHIREQWEALGVSVDYDKERFTLDHGLYEAVTEVFIRLYEKGLIYRGERIINWDVEAKTALSNIEVEHKEIEGAFYFFKYMLEDGSGFMEIATTRPETMYGDTALMVHPDDERFRGYVGKKAYIPGTDRLIPIIEDDYVDMEFGTGCVKVTPAHDPNDFEVGRRHDLDSPLCMNEDGTMNELAHKYEGMDRFECRKACVKDLQESGLCTKIEKLVHNVGHSERTGVIVEPRLSKQWFVHMEPLSKQATELSTVEFVPKRFEKTFLRWMDGTFDWCISRQLWWGHRIPAWYRGEEVYVGKEAPQGDGWVQDEDVLDTWFSSALWPFSTLGWPHQTDDLKRYYPTDTMVTGYDIIFFWVARMIFQALEFTGESPFKQCLIHGLIRDSEGRKMSKSLGNGVDPMDIKSQYGMDTLRYFLTTNSAPGMDLRFEIEKVESSWNFINKLWNISRFILMNLGEFTIDDVEIDTDELPLSDQWILAKLHQTITEMDYNYEKFEFGEAAKSVHQFSWEEFAAWYVEISKIALNSENESTVKRTKSILSYVLLDIMKLLHPFMPFVTEAIYQQIPHVEESIMISNWPEAIDEFKNPQAIKDFELIQDIIKAIRNVRAEYNVAPSKPIHVVLKCNAETQALFRENEEIIHKFINPEGLELVAEYRIDTELVSIILPDVEILLPLGDLVDIDQEITRLEQELKRLTGEIKRCQGMLSNPNFLNKAPEQKVAQEREKLVNYQEQFEATKSRLAELKQ